MIIPLYQPLGSSTHLLAQKLGNQVGEPTTHTGTLDPMAEGVIICLTGEDRFQKQQHSSVLKEYQFSVLLGFSTDSHDLLGLSQYKKTSVAEQKIETALQELTGTYHQQIPSFSAKRVNGESLFDQAKKGRITQKFNQEVTVHSLQKVKSETISLLNLEQQINSRIAKVEGDFRQQEILTSWKNTLSKAKQEISQTTLFTFTATTSKRTYIRGIVRDLSEKLDAPLTTFHILRTKNGAYQIKDCTCLV
jgi:tRNA pseudouridine(55) synthase